MRPAPAARAAIREGRGRANRIEVFLSNSKKTLIVLALRLGCFPGAIFSFDGTATPLATAPGGSFLHSERSEVPKQERRGPERSKPANAKRLLRGKKLDYGIWFDPTVWSGTWTRTGDQDAEDDIKLVRPGLSAFVRAEPFPTSFSTLADGVVGNFSELMGITPVVLLREIRRVNGNDMLALELSVENGLESGRAFGYIFSNDTETIRFMVFGQAAMEAERNAVEDLLDGLVLNPPPDAGGTGNVIYRRRHRNPSDPAPQRVEGEVCPPILRTRVEPVYPEVARRSRESGVVILEAVIEADGGVSDLAVLKATREPLLDEAALRAVSQWEYQPATKEGKPVPVYLTVTVNFQLHSENEQGKK